MRLLLPLTLATLVLASVSSCSTAVPPAPVTSPVNDRFGAPTASEPLDVRSFGASPCTGPWAGTVVALGFPATGRQSQLETRYQACEWDAGGEILGLVVYPDEDILVDSYRARLLPIFVPTTIAGLPAVIEQSSSNALTCTATIGTASGQGLALDYTRLSTRSTVAPCARAQQIAERIVATLPPLSSK